MVSELGFLRCVALAAQICSFYYFPEPSRSYLKIRNNLNDSTSKSSVYDARFRSLWNHWLSMVLAVR